MSVINQMLKDLEQRSPEANTHSTQPAHVALTYSPRKIALVTGIFVLAVCLISFYVWQLMSENKALKAEQFSTQISNQATEQPLIKSLFK